MPDFRPFAVPCHLVRMGGGSPERCRTKTLAARRKLGVHTSGAICDFAFAVFVEPISYGGCLVVHVDPSTRDWANDHMIAHDEYARIGLAKSPLAKSMSMMGF